jgi:hypothetical protein
MVVLFSVLAGLLMLYFILNRGNEKRYQWYESYNANNAQPYGALFIKRLLETYRPGGRFIFNDKSRLQDLLSKKENQTNTDYIFIGESLHLDSYDADALLNFVEAGNDAFIASLEPPESLIYRIHTNECGQEIEYRPNRLESVVMNFFHGSLRTENGYRYAYRFRAEDVPYYWNEFHPQLFCDSSKSIIPVGFYSAATVNFVMIPYGKGNVYLHANPIAFTNYFLTKPEGVEYASSAFSHLKGNNIIWDEYSKVPFIGNNNEYNSPLYYILQQPTLKYAWWLMLITIALYIFFAARRTQRVIPVLETKSNTSLEFIKLISSLHYRNGNHLDMATKKMKYFLYFIRSKYGVHAQTFTEPQIQKLAEKSRVNLADVQGIFYQYNIIERNKFYNIEAGRLVDFYNAIENFYKHCK